MGRGKDENKILWSVGGGGGWGWFTRKRLPPGNVPQPKILTTNYNVFIITLFL